MAESVVKNNMAKGTSINWTEGNNLRTITMTALLYGKVLVISYYLVPSANIARLDVIATFDIPTDIMINCYDGAKVVLKGNSKQLLADNNFTAGTAYTGQVVGIIY